MLIKVPKAWEGRGSTILPQSKYLNRRQLLKSLGFLGIGASVASATPGCFLSVEDPNGLNSSDSAETFTSADGLYPAPRNQRYQVPERGVTPTSLSTMYNNFYEFTTAKRSVWELVDRFQTSPWTLEVGGMVQNPQTFDLDSLLRQVQLEERVYRFRCVEAWSMTVPWTGFPFSQLINLVQPLSSARYVSMLSVNRPEEMPGIDARPALPWAYAEGLTIEEAMNEMALLATGLYGEPLPRQNGAPIRLVVPWKYGFKSIKSIVSINFTDTQPPTFWNTAVPSEYPFESNIDPAVPHPRWSQATERLLDNDERLDTMQYNGYGEYVAHLYA